MKTLIFCTFFVSLLSTLSAQEERTQQPLYKKHAVYGELLGQGLLGSLNYEYTIKPKGNWTNSYSVGAAYIPRIWQFGTGEEYINLNLTSHWLRGKSMHKLEIGSGLNYSRTSFFFSNNLYAHKVYLQPLAGYRLETPNSRFIFRLTATFMVNVVEVLDGRIYGPLRMNNALSGDLPIVFWPGASVGYRF